MILKRSFVLTFFMLFSIGILASDVPIIFVHGHKSEAIPLKWDNDKQQYVGGWTTWYPMKPDLSLKFPTAMTKIADSHYGGYQYGLKADGTSAITCDKTTQLQSGQGTKRIFNFSYYHPDGSRGVISLSEDSVLVYIKWVYDALGRPVPAVIAPFDQNYPPSNYDSTTYYPKYVPHLSLQNIPGHGPMWIAKPPTIEYVKSWKKGKYAKRLADFIDKVLTATGAQKVDIVAHSMGGLVARAAIKEYNYASKVRKLITIGTPNKGCHYPETIISEIYDLFNEDPTWERAGEDLELNADAGYDFADVIFNPVGSVL